LHGRFNKLATPWQVIAVSVFSHFPAHKKNKIQENVEQGSTSG